MNGSDLTQGGSVLLKTIDKGDAEFLCHVANDLALKEILGNKETDMGFWTDAVEAWSQDPDEEGFIIIRKADPVSLGWIAVNGLCSQDGIAWIKMLAILPQYWGLGYGASAVSQVKEMLSTRGFRYCRLWTDKSNSRSQKCYRRCGFEAIAEGRGIAGTGQVERDGVLMACTLSP